ncbi:Epimerase domain-containing protein [Mycena sanguinolenta]|uniref:Epimerase domain-containing protein n=1 Tax=Mycena sanguinolenta TaxID=230812 RepID=A0A8H6ZDP9_9AGAR|nr:Epimerase domain-containing protein [Mycena sanguinolenta]
MSTESKPLVFVTGASGFLGFEVVYQLLEAGYPVRGAARGRKIPLKKALEKYPQFEAVEISDVASGDFSAAFKDVGAIIHTAAPLPGRADSETALKSAIEGSLHILREALKAGVKKFIATGSMVTFLEDSFGPNGESYWVPVTKEQAVEEAAKGNHFVLYTAEKKFGEQAVLEFADKHPEMDITICIYHTYSFPKNPNCYTHIIPEPDFAAFSTNGFIYQFLRPDNANYNYSPGMIDVRDAARVHIAGLTPLLPNHPKCVPLVAPETTEWRAAIACIAEARRELHARLADPERAPVWGRNIEVDLGVVERAFGVKSDSYKTWKETILASVDRFIEVKNI